MKCKLLILLITSLFLLSYPVIAFANNAFLNANKEPQAKLQQLDQKLKMAHEKIAEDFNLNLGEWIQIDLSDIPDVVNGAFPGIDKETGLSFVRAYTFGKARDYHRVGDYKPLLLINKNTNTALVGFLHSDGTSTLIELQKSNADNIKLFTINKITNK